MTATTYQYSGLQNAIVYALNSMGRPLATGLIAYNGVQVFATKLYNLTLPAPRRVPHVGNDRLLATQIFPTQEAAGGELSVGAEDLDLIALLSGSTIKETAGLKMLPHMSDLQGKEPSVAMILWQSAIARGTKAQGYHYHMVSATRAVVRVPGAGNDPIDVVYDLAPNPTEYYIWGEPLAPLADIYDPLSGVSDTGAFESGIWSGFGDYPPRIASFISGASTTVFEFSASVKPALAASVAVFTAAPTDAESVEVDPADYTATVDEITFDIGLDVDTEVHVLFQQAI